MQNLIQNKLALRFASMLVLAFFLFQTMSLLANPPKSKRGFFGVSVQEMTPSLRQAMKLGDKNGLLITSIIEDSPADEAGLKEEDVILTFDGKAVEIAGRFSKMVRKAGAGTTVELTVFRDRKTKKFEITLGRKKRQNAFAFSGERPGRNMIFTGDRPRLGIEYHDLDEKALAAYFKVEQRSGVLILDVTKDSPAEKGGLLPGDVIVALGDEKINDGDDLIETLSDYEGGGEMAVSFVRKGMKKSTKVEFDESTLHGDNLQYWYKTVPHPDRFRWQNNEEFFFLPRDKNRHIHKFKKGDRYEKKTAKIIIESEQSI